MKNKTKPRQARWYSEFEAVSYLIRHGVQVGGKLIARQNLGLRLKGAKDFLVNIYGYRSVDKKKLN